MVKKSLDVLSLLRAILAQLDQDKLHLAAVYIEKAIEIIERGDKEFIGFTTDSDH